MRPVLLAICAALVPLAACGRSDVYTSGGEPVLASASGTGGSQGTGGSLAGSIAGSVAGSLAGSIASSGATTGPVANTATSGAGTSSGTRGTSSGLSSSTSGIAASCSSNTDCSNLETACVGGTCQLTLCGPGTANGTLDSTCTVPNSGVPGSCLPSTLGSQNVGLCAQGGPADGGCSPGATRATVSQACVAGDFCVAGLGDSCAVLCDPFAFQPCGLGEHCVTVAGQSLRLGVCAPAGASIGSVGATGSSTGGTVGTASATASGGSSGGMTSSSSGTTGGGPTCSPTALGTQFSPCQTVADCLCPYVCTFDGAAGGQVCEYPCVSSSDCSNLTTTCQNQTCAVTQCGGATGNGSFNGTCTVQNPNDGTCEPLTLDGGLSSVGYCSLAGTATSNCDPNPTRLTASSQICTPGSLCFGGFETFGGTCNALCDPDQGVCPQPNQFCSSIVNEPDLGICISGF